MMDAQQIYDNFHSQARGTGGLGTGQEAAQRLAASSQNRAVGIQQLITGIQAGWTGSAADAAAQGLVPYSLNELDTQEGLTIGQSVIERQMNSFQTAASEVLPAPPAPQPQNIVAAIVGGQDPTSMYQQLDVHYAVQAVNVDAYNKYVGASQDNTVGMPKIIPVDLPDASVSVSTGLPSASRSESPTGTSTPYERRQVSSTILPVRSLATAGAPGVAPPASIPTGNSGQPVTPGPGSSSTAPCGDAPGPALPPGHSPPVGPGPSAPTSPPPPSVPIGPVTGVTTGSADPVPVESATGVGSQRSDAADRGPGSGSVGFVGMVEPDPWSASSGRMLPARPVSNGAGDEPEVGPRSGVDTEVVAQSESLGSGTSGARTSALAEAGPMGAGRRSPGDEDDEYTSKYLEEQDGDQLLGGSEATVSSVIGENIMERARRRDMVE